MKKLAYLLATSCLLLVILLSGSVFTPYTKAQICTGSATCESNCGTVYTPSGCKITCNALDISCVECTGSSVECDETNISCGFDNVWGGSCAADCSSVGGTYAGGNCSSSTPPPPPPNRWTCGSGYQCVQSTSGYSTYSSCDANCNPPPTPLRYGCSGTSCVQQAGGAYTSATCGGACNPVQRYSCSGTSCVANASGPYTSSNCGGACEPTKYSCSGNSCVVDSSGPYTTSNCDGDCGGEVCNTCGCPGYQPCTCTSEHQCGDPAQWDCCPQGCVPEGTPCGGSCSAVDEYKGAYVWVRVVSQENSGTAAWKGTQANDPVVGGNWSVSTGSGGGLDAEGYFKTYKPADQNATKTFDKNKNIISNSMRLEIGQTPTAPNTYVNKCGEVRTYPDPGNIAHGGTWSNHFCTAGYTYQISGGIPQASNYYCEDNIDGPVYFKEDDQSASPVLDCDGTPRVWPLGDPDGCYEGLSIPLNEKPTGQDVVRSSAHDQITPLLQYAAGAASHWADMAFDGYWTYSYMAWEQYQNTDNIETVITLHPPINHYCTGVRWFNNVGENAQEQSTILKVSANIDGGCTATFNPKAAGNLVVMEVARIKNQSCTVRFEDANNPGVLTDSVDTNAGFNVHVIGNSSQVIPPLYDKTRLYFAKPDFSRYTGVIPDEFNEVSGGGRYYYQFDPTVSGQSCDTNSEESCAMTATLDPNSLAQGDYDFFCDVLSYDSSAIRCSGNTACTFNYYNSTNNTASCSAYADCVDDSQIPRDHGDATVQCVFDCNTCSLAGADDGCGGTCANAGIYAQTPAAPSIIDPAAVQTITTAAYTFPVSWTQPGSITVEYDYNDVIVYKQNVFPSADAAWAVRDTSADVLTYTSVIVNSVSIATPSTGEQNIGKDLVVAVRAVNSPSGTNPCAANPVLTSTWATKNFSLVGTVSGNIQDDPEGDGPPSPKVPANFPGGTVTFESGAPGFIFNQQGTISLGGTSYSVPNVPYFQSTWAPTLYRRLTIVQGDPQYTYVCSDYAGQNGAGTNVCSIPNTSSPMSSADFYVKSYNLAFDSWWQSWGGSVFGKTDLGSDIPDGDTSPCEVSSNCHPHLVAANHSQSSPLNQSAGVAVTEDAAISTGTDSRFSEQSSPANNPSATDQETSNAAFENYTYFISGTNLGIPTSSDAITDTKTASNVLTTADDTDTLSDGTQVKQYHGNLTLDLSSTKLTVASDQSYIIFVAGDLLVQGPTGSHTNATTQQQLIRVNTGGYLAFIVGGNITFDSQIGYDDANGDFTDVGVSALNTPNIEGVYIASGTLTVASKNASSDTPEDYKFVGGGTFVGWGGVNLQRKFDSSNQLRRQLNNTSPTELFIHRPDLVINTPEFMMRPNLSWQEVP